MIPLASGLCMQLAPWALREPLDPPPASESPTLSAEAPPRSTPWLPRVTLQLSRRGRAVGYFDPLGRPFAPSLPWGTTFTVTFSWGGAALDALLSGGTE